MGPQRVLQAAVAVAIVATSGPTSAAPRERTGPRERIALIDLGGEGARGSGFASARKRIEAAIVAAGFLPLVGDGVDDALAGLDTDRDSVPLTSAIADAQRAFGDLRCKDVAAPARQAIGILAARQAAGRPVPELPRAWSFVLLCADRDNQIDAALAAANQLRALGGSPDVPAAVWAKYPEVDAVANREFVPLEIDTEVPGAAIWIDFRKAGVSPLRVQLPAGEHVIAAAAGSKRGWAAGTAIASQKSVRVPLSEAAGPWSDVAQRVARWNGKLAAPPELGWVLARVRARIAIVRHGDTIEAWGRAGLAEPPHLLGGDDGTGPVSDIERVLGVVSERVVAWTTHSPDPDRPLLVEQRTARAGRGDEPEKRKTKWWVYAAIAGAAAIGITVIYAHDSASDRQRVELHYP